MKTDLYSLSLVDNLIVVNNLTEKRSFIFDTKRNEPSKTIEPVQSILIMEEAQPSPSKDSTNFLNPDNEVLKRPDFRRAKSAPNEDEEDQDKSQRRNNSTEKYKEIQEQALIMEANLEDYDKEKEGDEGIFYCIKEIILIRKREEKGKY